jgi:hypothetical protein
MPRPKTGKDAQVTLAIDPAWLDEAQTIAEARSEPGLTVTRADVLRMALRRGLDVMGPEAERHRRAGGTVVRAKEGR